MTLICKQNSKKLNSKLATMFMLAIFLLFSISFALADDGSASDFNQTSNVCIHAFLSFDCPQCSSIIPFLKSIADEKNVDLKLYDVSMPDDKEMYDIFKEVYSLDHGGYPIVFIGDKFFLGETDIRKYIETEIKYCLKNECHCPVEKTRAITYTVPRTQDYTPEESQIITLPLINKEIDLNSMSLGLVTLLISFIDGFNPCSLWLLFFLLGILILARSRIKMIIVGLTFLTVTALGYGLFISGIFSVFSYIHYIKQITYIVAGIALFFGLINLKDYFWYKKGISLTISDKYKPTIFKRIRNIMRPDSSIPQMIFATIIFALGITLVELPCTAGLPMIWSNILAANNVSVTNFVMLLGLYLLVYLSIEIVILVAAIITMSKFNFEEKHGRILKLISGVIMLFFAYNFAFNYDFVNTVTGLFSIILLSGLTVVIIVVFHRIVLPKLHLFIGTEFGKDDEKENEDEDSNKKSRSTKDNNIDSKIKNKGESK